MTAAELAARIEAHDAPVIVDARSRWEFRAGHVPGALNLPSWRLIVARRLPVDGRSPVVVYCGRGPRALVAGAVLRWRGVRQVVMLDGHWAAWRQMPLHIGAQSPSRHSS